jgi:undecaprenyl-diphosphatase
VLVIGVVVGVGAVAALVTRLAAEHWRRADPSAPAVSPETVRHAVRRWDSLREALRHPLNPERTTGVALAGALAVVIAAAIGVGVMVVMVRTNIGLARWDAKAADWGARHATDASTSVLKVVTQLGGTFFMVTMLLLVAAFEIWRSRNWSVVGFLAAVFIGITVIVAVTKSMVDRARPDIDRLVGFSGQSFPSGHAAASAACFAAVALLLGRSASPSTRRTLIAVAVGIACAVASTRILLGVHWFTDTIGGLLIGWAWFALCSIAFGGRRLRFGVPVAQAERAAVTEPALRR